VERIFFLHPKKKRNERKVKIYFKEKDLYIKLEQTPLSRQMKNNYSFTNKLKNQPIKFKGKLTKGVKSKCLNLFGRKSKESEELTQKRPKSQEKINLKKGCKDILLYT